MAALNRPITASYEIHETARADTSDDEDHTFCGIMFPVKAKNDLPVEKIIINALAVRGQLGDLSVWVSNEDVVGIGNNEEQYNFRLHSRRWTKIYEKNHPPSQRKYDRLDLSQNPIILKPGQVRAIYIHSTLPGDEAIVYDNSQVFGNHRNRPQARYQDKCIAVYSGKAHLSNTPFGQTPIWGWGNAWRDRREFVGQIHYGAVYRLWNPDRHLAFGPNFRKATETMLVLQRRDECPVSFLPDECIYYILNMCGWNWFEDCPNRIKVEQRMRRRKIRENTRLAHLERHQQPAPGSTAFSAAFSISSLNNSIVMDDQNDCEPRDGTGNDAVMTDIQLLRQQASEEEDGDEIDDDDDDEDESFVDDDNDSESEDRSWEAHHGYRADDTTFRYLDASSSEEESVDDGDQNHEVAIGGRTHRSWFRSHFPRISIIRALAANRNAAVHMDT